MPKNLLVRFVYLFCGTTMWTVTMLCGLSALAEFAEFVKRKNKKEENKE